MQTPLTSRTASWEPRGQIATISLPLHVGILQARGPAGHPAQCVNATHLIGCTPRSHPPRSHALRGNGLLGPSGSGCENRFGVRRLVAAFLWLTARCDDPKRRQVAALQRRICRVSHLMPEEPLLERPAARAGDAAERRGGVPTQSVGTRNGAGVHPGWLMRHGSRAFSSWSSGSTPFSRQIWRIVLPVANASLARAAACW